MVIDAVKANLKKYSLSLNRLALGKKKVTIKIVKKVNPIQMLDCAVK